MYIMKYALIRSNVVTRVGIITSLQVLITFGKYLYFYVDMYLKHYCLDRYLYVCICVRACVAFTSYK